MVGIFHSRRSSTSISWKSRFKKSAKDILSECTKLFSELVTTQLEGMAKIRAQKKKIRGEMVPVSQDKREAKATSRKKSRACAMAVTANTVLKVYLSLICVGL